MRVRKRVKGKCGLGECVRVVGMGRGRERNRGKMERKRMRKREEKKSWGKAVDV